MTSSPDGNEAARVSDRATAFAYRGEVTVTIRRLVSGEEGVAEAYLVTVPERTLFLRSNLARAGFAGDGRPFSGVYAGAFDDNDDGALAGLVAHFWNDNIVVAPGPHAEALALHAVALTGRRVGGILGPHAEVTRVRAALGLEATAARFVSKEILYALALEQLVVPLPLSNGDVIARAPSDDEMAALLERVDAAGAPWAGPRALRGRRITATCTRSRRPQRHPLHRRKERRRAALVRRHRVPAHR